MSLVTTLENTPTVSPHWLLHQEAAGEIKRLRLELEKIAEADQGPNVEYTPHLKEIMLWGCITSARRALEDNI